MKVGENQKTDVDNRKCIGVNVDNMKNVLIISLTVLNILDRINVVLLFNMKDAP